MAIEKELIFSLVFIIINVKKKKFTQKKLQKMDLHYVLKKKKLNE